jgi:hypothetical protein
MKQWIESTISATEFALHSVDIIGACFASWIDIVSKIPDEQMLNPIITYDQE